MLAITRFIIGPALRLRREILLWASCWVFASGCASTFPAGGTSESRTALLRNELLRLGDRVDQAEASRLAQASVELPMALAREYAVVRPAWLHNNLVNLGLRDRGLCYHWANDLFARLQTLDLQSLELQLAVANMDRRREHNAIVVTARGRPLSEGIVLDAWRRSGRLWWGYATTDKYHWQPLPRDRVAPELEQFFAR